MANQINIFFFFSFLIFSVSSASSDVTITAACKASREPETCKTLLSLSGQVPPTATTPAAVIQSALNVSIDKLKSGEDMIHVVQRDLRGNINWTNAVSSCLESIQYSKHRLKRTSLVLKQQKNHRRVKDARAWLSAALAYQYNCWSGLRYTGANTTASGANATEFFNSTLMPITSSALGMLFNYDVVSATSFDKWAPAKTERDGFWEPLGASRPPGWTGEVPKGLKANATVCKKGCAYDTVQKAVDSAPANLRRRHGKMMRYVIRIEAGVYNETVRVPLNKTNVVLLGEGMGKTVITGCDSVGLEKGMTTYNSAVVGVVGDGFMAANLTINNTAPAGANQAVAFRSDSDHSVLESCEFIGNQDTLNAVSLRQLYKCCKIQGNVDFIFGNAAAVFEDCTILVAPRLINPEKGEKNSVTAHGRTDPAQSTGFVFRNSVVNGTKEYMDSYYNKTLLHKSFLGRPWKEYSRTVFIECTLGALISPEGWMPWQGEFALQTLYYGEFGNTGPGSNTSERVNWSRTIPAEHVGSYSPQNFIQLY